PAAPSTGAPPRFTMTARSTPPEGDQMDDHAGGPRRVGFLADTHSAKADGSDLPDEVLAGVAGVDLVVHLGDIGRKGILDRLLGIAPVLVPVGDNKGYVPWQGGGAEGSG